LQYPAQKKFAGGASRRFLFGRFIKSPGLFSQPLFKNCPVFGISALLHGAVLATQMPSPKLNIGLRLRPYAGGFNSLASQPIAFDLSGSHVKTFFSE
jgi:hypothetical protein